MVDAPKVLPEDLAALLLAVGDRDAEAFGRLYTLTAAKLFGICLRICNERQLAEDVLQEVYLTIWRRAGSFDPARGGAVAWMGTIARNRSIDHRRAQPAPHAGTAIDLSQRPDPEPIASERMVASQDAARLHACLDQLSEQQRGAIRSAFFDGYSYAQIAARRETPLGTIKSWVRRGLQSLKACLDDD